MTPSNTAMIAITSSMWIKPPTVVKKNPMAQAITRITAMMYNNEFMNDFFS